MTKQTEAAKAAGSSYEDLTGDFSQTSFSASRLATKLRRHTPVFAGLAIGLKPADLDLPPDTITADIDLLKARERLRVAKATERQADLSESILATQLRIADAAERQAEALEIVAALFASIVGVGNAACTDESGRATSPAVNFVRTGLGRKDFRCDDDSVENANDAD